MGYRIVAEQRFVKKSDGKRWLQCRYIEPVTIHCSGDILGNVGTKLTDWEDVPLCEEDFDDE